MHSFKSFWPIAYLTITIGVSISAFASPISIPIGTTNSAEGLKICVITAGIKKSRIRKGEKSMIN